jgi:hypothetical protein
MTTDAPFDPCRQWLGIDAVDVGNSRLLLGVSLQESDPLVVLRAAEVRLNLLRAISPGPFELARAGLVKRVEEAREKLLTELAASPSRSRPTATVGFAMPRPPSSLAVPLAPAVPPAMPPLPPAVPAVPGHGAFSDGGGLEQITIRTTVYRKRTPVTSIVLTLLVLSAAAGGLAYYSFEMKDRAKKPKGSPKNTALVESAPDRREADPPRQPAEKQRPRPQETQTPVDTASDEAVSTAKRAPPRPRRRPRPPEPNDDASGDLPITPRQADPEPVDPEPVESAPAAKERPMAAKPAASSPEPSAQDTAGLDDTLAEALAALRREEYDTVERLLAAPGRGAGGAGARGRIAAWQQLAEYFKGFLGFRKQALKGVKAGDEYDVNGKKVVVVDLDDGKFKYRSAGMTKAVEWDKIPGGIVLAIVTQWFDENPANDLYVGAYHMAKPESDSKRAREHWEKAQAGGADASALMPLLDDPVFARVAAEEN